MNVKKSSFKVPVFFCRIVMKLEFSQQISVKSQISNFVKALPAGVELFHADTQTDRRADGHDANSRFLTFCERA